MGGRWFVLAVAAGTAVCCAGVFYGAWWLTFPVGVACGLVLRARSAIPAGALAGGFGWGLLLAWGQWHYGLGPTAHALAAILGFAKAGPVVPVLLTCLVGLLLGLTGAWVGAGTRSVIFSGQSAISR